MKKASVGCKPPWRVDMQEITSLRIMIPLDVKHRWMFLVNLAILLFLQNHVSGDLDMCKQKKILIINETTLPEGCHFQSTLFVSGSGHQNSDRVEICFSFKQNGTSSDCCPDFDCPIIRRDNIFIKKSILTKQHIVLMPSPNQNFKCTPSKLCNPSVFLLNLEECLNKGVQSYQLADCQRILPYNENECKGLEEAVYIIIEDRPHKEVQCVSCKRPGKKPEISIAESSYGSNSQENVLNVMNNLTSLLEKMGNYSTAAITIGDIRGVLTKLSREKLSDINIGIPGTGDMTILGNNSELERGLSREVMIPEEAYAMAIKRKATFAAILSFPGIHQDKPDSYLINDEMLGIEMGPGISNLSHSIDILYTNVNKTGNVPSCRSWNGAGRQNWITDGCQTKEFNDSIICQCSHLTFFAILMSPPTTNITAAEYNSLTYITSIGCGLSMFFLGVAVFMHFVIRKGKASQATSIMMNLFVAMFIMNLSFLINESIAELDNFGACVTIAAVMHYALLATFSWFFMEALHLYINLWKLPSEIKHYMAKICITGWVIPAIVVITLLASREYGLLVITTSDGSSSNMCWIVDAAVLQWVNIGYYAIVFIFTLSIFIITVQKFVLLRRTMGKNQDKSCSKANSFSILALLFLLGITWAFAFFSHGPLLIPSYYIFTILNSLQGFFLFIYYYNSSKIVIPSASDGSGSMSSTIASDTVLTSPYQ